MTHYTQPTQIGRQLNTALVEIDAPATALLTEAKRLLEDRARTVIELGIALGKTIEARASVALATTDPDQSAAAIISEAEETVAAIVKRFYKSLCRDNKYHSEQESKRINDIRRALSAPFPDERKRSQRRFSDESRLPIDFMAIEVGAIAAITCDWAISVATTGTVSKALERRLETIISIERFIIELGNSLGEEARGLSKLRNPSRRDSAVAAITGLLGDIRDAGSSLAEEASGALSYLPPPSQAPKPRPKNWARLPLYHGTSGTNLRNILKEGCLRASGEEEEPDCVKVSLTLDRSVAEYFACQAALRDTTALDDAKGNAVVLELDGEGLGALLHELRAGEVGWEREITCSDIEQLDRVLISQEPVPPERFADFLRLGRKAFMPTSEFKPDFALQLNQLLLHDRAKSAPRWWH